MSSFDKSIQRAINGNKKSAGRVLTWMRYKMGMNYRESLERFRKVSPDLTMGDFEVIMETLDRPNARA